MIAEKLQGKQSTKDSQCFMAYFRYFLVTSGTNYHVHNTKPGTLYPVSNLCIFSQPNQLHKKWDSHSAQNLKAWVLFAMTTGHVSLGVG